ncbi:hypothetical protein INR49_010699 [Caranx melampygus]|nr:hypothetical protein INR49_010699 [Caranx melampygus]
MSLSACSEPLCLTKGTRGGEEKKKNQSTCALCLKRKSQDSGMEEGYELDLTYITERIIAVSFPRGCSEEIYSHNLKDVTRMLKSKHADNYLIINLSERRHDLSKMNPKTLDTGWPDMHAPPLDKICTICKAMESWLNADPLHVVVIHCRALDRFAMRKYYDDKVSALMTPSQKRHIGPGHRDRVCITLEPAQLLKGDIMIKCYHKSDLTSEREVIFRLQFHTGAVQGYNLMFEKEDMEAASKDPRFPDYGKVELVFSEGPERIPGADRWQNGADVIVDYNTTDPLTRWDSYQNICDVLWQAQFASKKAVTHWLEEEVVQSNCEGMEGIGWLAVRWGMEGQDDRGDRDRERGAVLREKGKTSVLKPAHTFLEGTLREGFVGKLPAELTCMEA